MKNKFVFPHLASALAICVSSTIANAQAATDNTGQQLTLTPNATETRLALYWLPPPDDFGPRPPTCDLVDYTINVQHEGRTYYSFNRYNAPLQGGSGQCYFQRVLNPIGGGTKIAPGTWSATSTKGGNYALTEIRTIFACTQAQGKQPMYWTRNNPITDNFYTVSTSQRDISLGIGYVDRGVPFSMPTYAGRQVSQTFWRYYKGAPQNEHFYSTDINDDAPLTQAGYVYETDEGNVFKTYKPGSVALHRFVYFHAPSSDLQHLYSINRNDPNAGGMTYEGVVGYVCTP